MTVTAHANQSRDAIAIWEGGVKSSCQSAFRIFKSSAKFGQESAG